MASEPENRSRKRRRNNAERAVFNRDKYKIRAPCNDKCRIKCSENFTFAQRSTINNQFWGLSFRERRLWFDSHILVEDVKRRKVSNNVYERMHSFKYFLPVGLEKKHVCKSMFLSTLGMKTDGMITSFIAAKTKGTDNIECVLKDNRGSSIPTNKKNVELIKQHINSFKPQVSHYASENAPNRRYLDSGLTVKCMWRDFQSKNSHVSYQLYFQVFQAENIGFSRPNQDECSVCAKLNAHKSQPQHVEPCEVCEEGNRHLLKAQQAREAYRKDKEENQNPTDTSVFTADMQKVILLPKLTLKEHFFVSRLVIFNETFASLTGEPDLLILWHEAIAGRNATHVASAYIKCISACDKPNIIFWADNCTAQNKNWVLFTALVWCVNQEWGPVTIIVKFLEKGHTFMRADAVHGAIGRKMKNIKNIYTYDDFVEVCGSAASRNRPMPLQCGDFYQFPDGHRSRQTKKEKIPQLSDISEVKFEKRSRDMHYKAGFQDQEYTKCDFLKKKFALSEQPGRLQSNRGITATKKAGILKLTTSFPAAKIKFWQEIDVSKDVRDLVGSFD